MSKPDLFSIVNTKILHTKVWRIFTFYLLLFHYYLVCVKDFW